MRKKLTVAGWFWLTHAIVGILVLASLLAWCSSARAEAPNFPLAHPVCPNGFCVAQEILTWRRVGGELQIVKRRWVISQASHRIIYARH